MFPSTLYRIKFMSVPTQKLPEQERQDGAGEGSRQAAKAARQ